MADDGMPSGFVVLLTSDTSPAARLLNDGCVYPVRQEAVDAVVAEIRSFGMFDSFYRVQIVELLGETPDPVST